MLALHLDEIRRRNDFDALILTKLEQVLVSTHQIIRTARGRTFEDAVVSRVFFDGICSLLWFDMLCETGNLPDCLIDLLFWPAKTCRASELSRFYPGSHLRRQDGWHHLRPSPGCAGDCPKSSRPEIMTFVSAVTRSTFYLARSERAAEISASTSSGVSPRALALRSPNSSVLRHSARLRRASTASRTSSSGVISSFAAASLTFSISSPGSPMYLVAIQLF